MSIEKLDFILPFVVFGYGAIMTFVLNHPTLMQLAETRLKPEMRNQMRNHRGLGVVCLVVGSLWSLQNLWIG